MIVPETKIQRIRRRYEAMKRERSPLETTWNTIARYVLGRRNYMTTAEMTANDFFDDKVFDDTAINALDLMVSSLMGALWPNGAKTFRLELPTGSENELIDTDEEKKYWEFCTRQLASAMDNTRAGFATSYTEYLTEKGAFGISSLMVEETDDYDCPLMFRTYSAKHVYIDTGRNNVVDTVYIKLNLTLREIANEYGTEQFTSQELKSLQDYDNLQKYEIIIAIEPRMDYDPTNRLHQDFPYSSCHVDITNNRLLREKGFREQPIFAGRFQQVLDEKYGRSPAMKALPSIREINQLRYLLIEASEKMLFPPVNVVDGTVVGNDVIDLSARGVNVVSVSGKLGNYRGRPIEQTVDVNDPQWAFSRLTELIEIVKNSFYQDRLLDLNNETRMTLGEANIRNQLRGQTLNPIYARAEKEDLEPVITRCFNVMFGKGLLGVIKGTPEEANVLAQGIEPTYIPNSVVQRMVNGHDVYKIKFISPARRIMEVEELTGIQQTTEFAMGVMQADPTILDNYDFDFTAKRVAELAGAPSQMVKAADVVAKVRQQRQQQQQQMMQAQQMQVAASTAKDAAKANNDMEKSGQ